MVPARLVQAGSPFLFGLGLDSWGDESLWISGLLGFTATAALMCIPVPNGLTKRPLHEAVAR
jgi:hypothetical protein